jgi:hypothetical protein
MKRVTYKSIIERSSKKEYQELPKLKEILIDLSVKSTPKVVRKLRLVGHAMQFLEYSNKKRLPREVQEQIKKDTGKDRYFEEVPFPDAHLNSNFTRIGHDDQAQCPWKAMGYIASKKYAQKCLEEVDGKWVPKILCKGPSIFDGFAIWEQGRVAELQDDPSLSHFLGGDKAPMVEITATYDTSKLGDVDYKVHIKSKDIVLNEDMINILRATREPSADDLNRLRKEYNDDREEDDTLPEWRDYFEYSFDIRRIFQYTPPKTDAQESSNMSKEQTNISTDSTALNTPENGNETIESIDLGDINW